MRGKPFQILLRDYDEEKLNFIVDFYRKSGEGYVNVCKASVMRGLIDEKYNKIKNKGGK